MYLQIAILRWQDDGALFGAFANQGEVCSSGSRLIVERSIHKKIVAGMLEKISNIKLGPWFRRWSKNGLIGFKRHREKVERYIKIGFDEGAKLICGGKRLEVKLLKREIFLSQLFLMAVKPTMRIAREEIFPVQVLVVIPFDTEEEAIQIANDTEYGLAAAVWTKNLTRAHRVTSQIRAGILW